MGLNEILIGIAVLHLGVIGFTYYSYMNFRNIYTQKIVYMNDKFSKMGIDEIIGHKMSDFYTFKATIDGEKLYPPTVKESYLQNSEYESLVKKHDEKQHFLEKLVKRAILSCLILIMIVCLAYML